MFSGTHLIYPKMDFLRVRCSLFYKIHFRVDFVTFFTKTYTRCHQGTLIILRVLPVRMYIHRASNKNGNSHSKDVKKLSPRKHMFRRSTRSLHANKIVIRTLRICELWRDWISTLSYKLFNIFMVVTWYYFLLIDFSSKTTVAIFYWFHLIRVTFQITDYFRL